MCFKSSQHVTYNSLDDPSGPGLLLEGVFVITDCSSVVIEPSHSSQFPLEILWINEDQTRLRVKRGQVELLIEVRDERRCFLFVFRDYFQYIKQTFFFSKLINSAEMTEVTDHGVICLMSSSRGPQGLVDWIQQNRLDHIKHGKVWVWEERDEVHRAQSSWKKRH